MLLKAFGAREASSELHSLLLSTVLRLPMVFFDTTPIGRIVNRFGKDIDTLDINIPSNMEWFLNCLLKMLGTVVVIGMVTPFVLVTAIPLVVVYFLLQVQWSAATT